MGAKEKSGEEEGKKKEDQTLRAKALGAGSDEDEPLRHSGQFGLMSTSQLSMQSVGRTSDQRGRSSMKLLEREDEPLWKRWPSLHGKTRRSSPSSNSSRQIAQFSSSCSTCASSSL